MKGAVQTVFLAVGLVAVFFLAVPLILPRGASAIQATQLYSGAQMWLLGLIFMVGLLGQVAGVVESLSQSVWTLIEQMPKTKEDAADTVDERDVKKAKTGMVLRSCRNE